MNNGGSSPTLNGSWSLSGNNRIILNPYKFADRSQLHSYFSATWPNGSYLEMDTQRQKIGGSVSSDT